MQLFPQTTRKQNPKIPYESKSSTEFTNPKQIEEIEIKRKKQIIKRRTN